MKKENGITMITLAVTIIVLIILAGVSLNMTVGESGIITMAQKAKENMELAKVEEEEQLNSLYEELEKGGEGIFDDSMADAIEKLENFRKIIATAITNEGVSTASTDSAETMAENIGKILQERTKDATAMADDLSNGVTAYVNGQKITGNGMDVNNSYNNGYNVGYQDGKQQSNVKQYSMSFSIGINTTQTYNLDNYVQGGNLLTASITSWSEPYTVKATSFQLTVNGNVVTIKYSSGDVGFAGSGTIVFYYYE